MTAPSLLPHKNKKQVQQVTLPPIPSPNQQKQLQNISSRSRRQPLQLTHIYPVSQQTTATTDHPLPHNKTNPSIGLLYPTCLNNQYQPHHLTEIYSFVSRTPPWRQQLTTLSFATKTSQNFLQPHNNNSTCHNT